MTTTRRPPPWKSFWKRLYYPQPPRRKKYPRTLWPEAPGVTTNNNTNNNNKIAFFRLNQKQLEQNALHTTETVVGFGRASRGTENRKQKTDKLMAQQKTTLQHSRRRLTNPPLRMGSVCSVCSAGVSDSQLSQGTCRSHYCYSLTQRPTATDSAGHDESRNHVSKRQRGSTARASGVADLLAATVSNTRH